MTQHDVLEPRRIGLARTAHGVRDLLEIGAADAAGIKHEQRARRLAAEILVVMNGAAGNQQRFAGANLALFAIDVVVNAPDSP